MIIVAPEPPHPQNATERSILVIVPVALVLLLLPPLTLPFPGLFSVGTNQLDRSLERFQGDLRAAAPQSEAETLALPGAAEGHRELGLKLTVEGRHRHPGASALGDRERHVAIVGREGVPAPVSDRAGIPDVSVDRVGIYCRGIHHGQRDRS